MKRVKDIFAKICLFLFGTFGCMLFGAVIVYWIAGAIYLMVYSGEQVDPMQASEACARGMAVGYLSILGGALIGAILGCFGTLKYIASWGADGYDFSSHMPQGFDVGGFLIEPRLYMQVNPRTLMWLGGGSFAAILLMTIVPVLRINSINVTEAFR